MAEPMELATFPPTLEVEDPFADGLTSLTESRSIKGDTISEKDSRKPRQTITMTTSYEVAEMPALVSQSLPDDGDQEEEEPVVDSCDASPIVHGIHRSLRENADAREHENKRLRKPRLTLSAFRRPEHTIRLTNSDPGRLLEAEYDLHASDCGVLGHGAFSTVRLAVRRQDGVKVAVKSIAKHEALRSHRLRLGGRRYMEEWEILRRFHDHPYVVTLLDVFESDEEIQLVTEYCRGGELFDAIQKKRNRAHAMRRGQYSEAQAARITSQILRALVDLHAQGIVHRDVKPENILLADEDESSLHVKLCDFGVARPLYRQESPASSDGEASPFSRSRAFSIIGSSYYVAPEASSSRACDAAVDIYSLGVTLYILLCGFPPVFSGTEADEIVFPYTYWKDISDDAKVLVKKMLTPDASERLSAREALLDPWITSSLKTQTKRRASNERHVNLDLVRSRLHRALKKEDTSPSRKRKASAGTPPKEKRRRFERRASSALMALADLYRGVAATPSASAIAAGSPKKQAREATFRSASTAALSISW